MDSCSNCGKSVEGKSKICPHCGKPTGDLRAKPGSGWLGFLTFFGILVSIGIVWLLFEMQGNRTVNELIARETEARQVLTAVSLYMNDNDDSFPPITTGQQVEQTIHRYFADNNSKGHLQVLASSYIWNKELSGVCLQDIDSSTKELWLLHAEKPNERNCTLVGFADGRVRTLKSVKYTEILSQKVVISKLRK